MHITQDFKTEQLITADVHDVHNIYQAMIVYVANRIKSDWQLLSLSLHGCPTVHHNFITVVVQRKKI